MIHAKTPFSATSFTDISNYQTPDCSLDGIPPSCLDFTCSFAEYEKFKSLKNEAKASLALNNLSYAQKESFRNIVRTYRHLTETTHNLRILKEFRKALKVAAKQSPQLPLEEIISIFIKRVSSCKILSLFVPFISDHKGLGRTDIINQNQEKYAEQTKSTSQSLIEELTSLSHQKPLWKAIKNKYIKSLFGSKEFSLSLKGKKIEWLTGSTSASLVLMLEKTKHSRDAMSLKPLGRLLNENVVPLSGEINNDYPSYLGCGTMQHINEYHLSGTLLKDLEVAEWYANSITYHLPEKNDLELGIQSILNKLINCFGDDSDHYKNSGSFINEIVKLTVHLKIYVLKLLNIYGISDEMKEQIDQKIKKIISLLPPKGTKAITEKNLLRLYATISKILPQNLIDGLTNLLEHDFDKPIHEYLVSHNITLDQFSEEFKTKANSSFSFKINSPEEILEETNLAMQSVSPLSNRTLNHVRSAFPLIWASITVDSFIDIGNITVEKPVQGSLELGKDIQVAFTEDKNIDKLREMLGETEITVLPIEYAYHMRFMALRNTD
jgi:hypothetical protein